MPQLILVRHGNTFESDQTPTYVGGKTDLNLTAKGEEQAQAIAGILAEMHMPLGAIICGPLIRTRRFAEIIGAKTNQTFTVDERLCEIDYGLWENKTGDEIRASYGPEMIDAWEQKGQWPEGMNWAPSFEKLQHNIAALMAEQHKKLLLPNAHDRVIITSNGILRFVYSHITGNPADKQAKVGTGCYCVLETTPSSWTIQSWNQKPV